MQGFTARLTAPRPEPLTRLKRAAGKRPGRFSPRPFCGAGEKRKRLYCFFTFARPAFIGRRRVAAAASLAALMLGGTRFSAFRFAKRKPRSPPARSAATASQPACVGIETLVVVTDRPAYRRQKNSLSSNYMSVASICASHFIFHLSSFGG